MRVRDSLWATETAARAGLGDEQAVGKSVLAGALFAGGLFFPPALFVAIAVAGSDIGDSHDTIIAVDFARTRDVQEMEDPIGKSREGPVIYLSVVRPGHRARFRFSCAPQTIRPNSELGLSPPIEVVGCLDRKSPKNASD